MQAADAFLNAWFCLALLCINSCINLSPANLGILRAETHFRFGCYRTPKALFGAAVKDSHSPLYVALRDNHDLIIRSFQKGRPDWAALVAGFAKLGIMDGDGKPPTLRGAQQTWYRVKRDRDKQRSPRDTRAAGPAGVVMPADAGMDETPIARSTTPMVAAADPPDHAASLLGGWASGDAGPPRSDAEPFVREEAPHPKPRIDFKPATFRHLL